MKSARSSRPASAAWPLAPGLVLLVLGAVLAAYFPALRGGTVWDDDFHVTRPDLRPVSGLARIWLQPGATAQYYPVLHSAFWIEHRLWGDAALGYHLTGVLLHAIAACCFILVLRRLAAPGAVLAGFIFALHPVCVESVAWISEQKNTLSTVFYLLSLLAYLRFDRDRKPGWYLAALGCFILALLSKSVTCTLPAALLVILWWRRGRLSWPQDVRPLVPWFLLALASGLFTAWIERRFIGAEGAAFALSPVARCLLAGRVIWFYLGKLLWPSRLVFVYPRWAVSAHEAWQYAFPLAAAGLLAVLWLGRRRSRAPLAAGLFFVGTLFPALGFFNVYPFIYSFVADHFQYLASLGIIALAAGAGARYRGAAGPAAAALLLAGLGVLTWRQAGTYRDAVTLYRATIERNPEAAMPRYNLAIILAGQGRSAEAIAQYEDALRINPDDVEAHNNLGVLLATLGRPAEALAHYRRALAIQPDYAQAENNLAAELAKLPGHAAEAIAHYERVLAIQPDYAEVHNNLANELAKLPGREAEAIAHYERAVRLKPDYAEAHYNLANELARIPGREAEAIAHYETAVRLEPGNAVAQYNLAVELTNLPGHRPEAIAHYEQAVRFKPDYAEAHNNLGIQLAAAGRLPEAIIHYERALAARPDFVEAHNNLATALARSGRVAEAVAQLEIALRLNPADASARHNLAAIRAMQVNGGSSSGPKAPE